MQCLEAVDDDHSRAPLLEEDPDPVEDPGKTLLVQDSSEALVEDRRADGPSVEEAEGLAVSQDLVERLGDGGEVHRGAFRGGVVERVLLSEDGLPGSRKP